MRQLVIDTFIYYRINTSFGKLKRNIFLLKIFQYVLKNNAILKLSLGESTYANRVDFFFRHLTL